MKTIIITGASSGIGQASARLLHKSGHSLVLAARTEEKLESLKKELGENVLVVRTDVTDYQQVVKMVDATIDRFGKIDVLINNAGLGYFEKVIDGQIANWKKMVDVNVMGVLNCIHATLSHLIYSKGQVVQLASVAAHHVFPNSGIYCATKHAVGAISESLRLELAGKIRVSTVSPGAVNTNFLETTVSQEMLQEYRDYFATGLKAETIAEQIRQCVECPDDAVISEIIIRPNRKNK